MLTIGIPGGGSEGRGVRTPIHRADRREPSSPVRHRTLRDHAQHRPAEPHLPWCELARCLHHLDTKLGPPPRGRGGAPPRLMIRSVRGPRPIPAHAPLHRPRGRGLPSDDRARGSPGAQDRETHRGAGRPEDLDPRPLALDARRRVVLGAGLLGHAAARPRLRPGLLVPRCERLALSPRAMAAKPRVGRGM